MATEEATKQNSVWYNVRLVYLCRMVFLASYISEAKAWLVIIPAVCLMQKTFSYWKELNQFCLQGCNRNFKINFTKTLTEFTIQKLATDPLIVCNVLSWNFDLSSE